MTKRLHIVPSPKKKTASAPHHLAGRRCQRCGSPIPGKNGLPDYARRFCERKECRNEDRSEQAIARSISGRAGVRCLSCRRSNKPLYVVTPEGAIISLVDLRTAFRFGQVPGAVIAPSRKVALMWSKARKQSKERSDGRQTR